MSGRSRGSNNSRSQAWACVVSMNTFINLMKRFSVEKRTRDGVGVSRGVGVSVRASLLLVLGLFARPWVPASLFSSPAGSTGVLIQGLWRVVQGSGAIAKV